MAKYLILIGIFFFAIAGVYYIAYNSGVESIESKYNKKALDIAEQSKHNTEGLNKEILELRKKIKDKKNENDCAYLLNLDIGHCLPK